VIVLLILVRAAAGWSGLPAWEAAEPGQVILGTPFRQ
jgi:hypothetical protein